MRDFILTAVVACEVSIAVLHGAFSIWNGIGLVGLLIVFALACLRLLTIWMWAFRNPGWDSFYVVSSVLFIWVAIIFAAHHWQYSSSYGPVAQLSGGFRIGDAIIPVWGFRLMLFAVSTRIVGSIWCIVRGNWTIPKSASGAPSGVAFASVFAVMGILGLVSGIGMIPLYSGIFYGIRLVV